MIDKNGRDVQVFAAKQQARACLVGLAVAVMAPAEETHGFCGPFSSAQ